MKTTLILAKTVSQKHWGALTNIKWPSKASIIPLIDQKGINFLIKH
jgi:hypothetical protein